MQSKNNQQPKRKTKYKPRNGRRNTRKGIAITLLLTATLLPPYTNSTQMLKIRSVFYDGVTMCNVEDLEQYVTGFIQTGKKIAFHINSGDLGKREFIDNGSGAMQFVMYSTGSDCYTLDTTTRHHFFAFFMTTYSDTNPYDNDASKQYACKVDKYITFNQLVPCVGGQTYENFEDSFKFELTPSAGPTVNPPWNRVAPTSKAKFVNMGSYILLNLVEFTKSSFPVASINDEIIQMLVLRPHSSDRFLTLAQYNPNTFQTMRSYINGVTGFAHSYSTEMFLKSISHDGLPGYHFFPDPARDDGRITFAYIQMKASPMRAASLHFYLSKPLSFGDNNIGVIEYRLVKRSSSYKLRPFGYNLKMSKDAGTGKIRFQLDRLATDMTSVVNSISVDVTVTANDEFIHFGLLLSEGLLYYTSNTEVYAKFYEVVWGWHDGQRYAQTADYGGVEKYEEVIGYGSNDDYYQHLRYKNYGNRANLAGTESTTNLFGVRFFSRSFEAKSYPRDKLTLTYPNNDDPESRCGLLVFRVDRCGGFASIRKAGDTPTKYMDYKYYNRGTNCPTSTCHICIREDNCLYPKPTYNKEMTTDGLINIKVPTETVASYEGSSAAAVLKRANRTQFIDNLSTKFYIKCPIECKLLF